MATNPITHSRTPANLSQPSVSPLDPSGSPRPKFSKTKNKGVPDLYQAVTNSIIKALEEGVKPWVCPWKRVARMSGIPGNYSTNLPYSGMNIMLLWASASQHGFNDSRWMTYKQAQEKGAQVRKGAKGTTAFFYSMLEKEKDNGEMEQFMMCKTFTLFNVQQIDGLHLVAQDIVTTAATVFDPLPLVEDLMKCSGAIISERGHAAYFRKQTDEIVLPERHLFKDAANFYATALHELTHWTGGKGRLDREMKGHFGSADYAYEELIAELGSAFLMADLGVVGEVQHESYIASWLKALKADKRFIFKAASAASKAHKYLMDLA